MVRDESSNWSAPISIFSDADIEVFVPDITTEKWLASHSHHFQETGTFPVSVYTCYKNDRGCKKEVIPAGHGTDPKWIEVCAELRYKVQDIVVDTRKKTVTVTLTILLGSDATYRSEYSFSGKTVFSFASPKDSLGKAMVKASGIVERSSEDYEEQHKAP